MESFHQCLENSFLPALDWFLPPPLFKKIRHGLSEYQQQTKCSNKEVKRLYEKFWKILDTATSKVNLEVKIDMAKETAFDHPSIRPIIKEVKKNAVSSGYST